jgi:hypothetical protein
MTDNGDNIREARNMIVLYIYSMCIHIQYVYRENIKEAWNMIVCHRDLKHWHMIEAMKVQVRIQ